jgi:prepilin-type N-terminal cleavage/methylation domain-containing protein
LDERQRLERRLVAMNAERGFTLLETALTIAIVAIVALATGAFFAASRPFGAHAASISFDALLGHARSVASTSGNGATIAVVNDATGFTATLYPGRPNAAGLGVAVETIHASAAVASAFTGATAFALFLNSAGIGTGAPWSAGDGTIAAEPPCPGALDLTFTAGTQTETRALACSDMRLR